jgi:hypothetical protein
MVPKTWWNRGMSKEGSYYVIDGTDFSFSFSIFRESVRARESKRHSI